MKLARNRLAACLAAAGFLLFAPAALAQTQLPPPAYGQADARQDRIEELERQLRDATAENERLQNELNQAQREVRRLNGMVGELAGVNQSLSEGQPPQDGAAPPSATPPATPPAQRRSENPTPAQVGSLGTLPAAPADAAPAYSQARELLVNGRYAEAEVAFRDFLQNYPQADTAADARYWLGFTFLARNNYRDAASTFVEYLQRTPQGPRAPEAQVRLGMALVGMDQKPQGCSAFAALARRYPNASRAVRDLAAREARAAQCAA
jgi:tol-pal system protein YbgF